VGVGVLQKKDLCEIEGVWASRITDKIKPLTEKVKKINLEILYKLMIFNLFVHEMVLNFDPVAKRLHPFIIFIAITKNI